jgi:hypothetical protein
MTKPANILDVLNGFSKAVTILLCFLLIVFLVQAISMQIIDSVCQTPPAVNPTPTAVSTEKEKLQYKVFGRSQQEFLPDGTLHFVIDPNAYASNTEALETEVYDAQCKLIWKGPRVNLPYRYVHRMYRAQECTFGDLRMAQKLGMQFSQTLLVPVVTKMNRPEYRDEIFAASEWWGYNPCSGQFVGMDQGGVPLGYLGPNGESTAPDQAGRLGNFVAASGWRDAAGQSLLLWRTKTRRTSYAKIPHRRSSWMCPRRYGDISKLE